MKYSPDQSLAKKETFMAQRSGKRMMVETQLNDFDERTSMQESVIQFVTHHVIVHHLHNNRREAYFDCIFINYEN